MIPRMAVRFSLRSVASLLLFALLAVPLMCASGQPFSAENLGSGSATIEGKWQFHLGDSLDWSNPSFDDSSWEQLGADMTWGNQTHPWYTGFAWYRKRIHVGGHAPNIAVLIPQMEDAYEVYWNGRKVGQGGKLPPHAWWWQMPRAVTYELGPAPLDGVLAVRVWKAPLQAAEGYWVGGFRRQPAIGSPSVLAMRPRLAQIQAEDSMLPRFMFAGALFITGIIALLLFLRERRNLLYLWLGLLLIANFLVCLEGLNPVVFGLSRFSGASADGIVLALQNISLWMLLLTLFGLHTRRAWKRWTVALVVLSLGALAVKIALQAFWEIAGPKMQVPDMICSSIASLAPVYLLVIVIVAVRKHFSWALLPLALTVTVYGIYNLLITASFLGIRYTVWSWPFQLNPGIPLGPYVFGIPAILNTLLFLVLLYAVAREQARERRRQAHIESEIASAHEVQDLLIPAHLPAIPGFAISSVYKPATEVGGDFYQVIPLPGPHGEPCVLILLGDVSGKGLKAAMTVSMIVGTVRALAEFTSDPADILTLLNQRLLGRTRGGFATCVALLIEPGGTTVIANAGHLAPFCDGHEIDLPGSLPLGLSADEQYESTTLHLEPGETLTLLTDGVLEARSPRGELYGFTRLSALMQAHPTVQQIVDAACSFGQEDDVTVLSVTRIADAESSDARLELVAQIAAAG